jgi:hypothetical protein
MDGNAFVVKGETAELKWGYRQAAVLSSWQITGGTATATVVSADAFRVAQQPLTLAIQSPGGHTWSWPVESLQIDGDRVTARLGAS